MTASFSANSATRLHPEEWSTRTAAGAAATLLVNTPHITTTQQLLDELHRIDYNIIELYPRLYTVRGCGYFYLGHKVPGSTFTAFSRTIL
jgi:hypothetical protein